MARAKRHYIPNQIWHITQRCHKREFLLIFKQDRQRWIQWLFEAERRFGLVVLNYVVTSNHIHLLLKDDCDHRTIPPAMGLIAGRTAQQYNQRKKRKGAFWQDSGHANAIKLGCHRITLLLLKSHWHTCAAHFQLTSDRGCPPEQLFSVKRKDHFLKF
jgi:putative transposase